MMVRPRRLVHKGVVEAAGFYFDARHLGLATVRRRVIAEWRSGARAVELGGGVLVRLAAPVRVDCAHAPGTPLVERGGVWIGAPLDPDEIERLAVGSGWVVLVRGGVAETHALVSGVDVEPHTFLDLEAFEWRAVESLGASLPRPSVVAAPEKLDPHVTFTGAPPASELADVIAELQRRQQGGRPAPAGRGGTFGTKLARWVTLFLDLFRARPEHAAVRSTALGEAPVARPGGPSFLERLWSNARSLVARFLNASALARLFTSRQAAYLAKTIDMFERGDLHEALRHAIPLGVIRDAAPSVPSVPAIGVPSPRSTLTIHPRRVSGGSSIGVSENLEAYMRRLYRDAYERLAAQGRIEEAAFVLAELLQADDEAIAFLERHERFALAAELAEGRNLAAGLIVRQWFLAGNVDRAVAIARRFDAFADAIARLRQKDPKKADVLRLLWATALADAGNFVQAVAVIWPIESARRIALTWLDAVIETGGMAKAEALVRKLVQDPATFDAVRERALDLLDDETEEHAYIREAFARALMPVSATPSIRPLARAAVRAILRDAAAGFTSMPPKDFRRLVDRAEDGALRTDVPSLPEPADSRLALKDRGQAVEFDIAVTDAGTMPVSDCALLPDGRLLVALGETGVVLLGHDGKQHAYFDQPAERLVVSDSGTRAIGLAQRGDVWRLARIDLAARTAASWCEAEIQSAAPSFDGSLWFVASQGDFYAIDATAKRFDALWRVPEIGAPTIGVARSAASVEFLTAQGDDREIWSYTLPALRLKPKTFIPAAPTAQFEAKIAAGVNGAGLYVDAPCWSVRGHEAIAFKRGIRIFEHGKETGGFVVGESHWLPGQFACSESWVAVPFLDGPGTNVLVVDFSRLMVSARIVLRGARSAAVKFSKNGLVIGDDCGRVLVFDVKYGRITRRVRV